MRILLFWIFFYFFRSISYSHIDSLSKHGYKITKDLVKALNATVEYKIVDDWGYQQMANISLMPGMLGLMVRNEVDMSCKLGNFLNLKKSLALTIKIGLLLLISLSINFQPRYFSWPLPVCSWSTLWQSYCRRVQRSFSANRHCHMCRTFTTCPSGAPHGSP